MLRAILFAVTTLIIFVISPSIRNLVADTLIGIERFITGYGPYSYVLGIAAAVTAMYAMARSAVR